MKKNLLLSASVLLGIILVGMLLVSSPKSASATCHGNKCPTPTPTPRPTATPTPTFTPTPTPVGSGSATFR